MDTFIHLDSLYLTVKYPLSDIYNHWVKYVEGVEHRILKQGVTMGDFVLRTGSSCYKFSIWKGDIRAYISNQTDEERGAGNGVGIWLQLGPKFINANGWEIQSAVEEFLNEIGVRDIYTTRITRLDFAIDVFDLDINSISFDEIRLNWVGRSQLSDTRTDNGRITGFEIGSRKSAVFLRIYDKVLEAEKKENIQYWIKIWGREFDHVTRFEWQIDPRDGHFPSYLQDFYQFDHQSIKYLADYLIDWGRLAIPNPKDNVRSRWEDSELWSGLRSAIREWNPEELDKLKRVKIEPTEISEKYVRQLAGTLSGGMARFNPENPNFADMFEKINEYVPLQEITMKAKRKGKRIQNLTQKNEKGENNDNG